MTLRVNHNLAVINSHRNLLLNDHNMSKTLEKLSSGMKINRAADGPATLVISEQMRAQIAGLTQAIENSETAVSMIQTTEANLAEVNSLLTNIRQLAIHAANEGVNDELMLKADQDEITNSLNTIDRIANQAQFGKKKLLDGSNGASGITTGKNLDFVNAGLRTRDSATNGFVVRITQGATKALLQGKGVLTQDIINKGETLTVIENGKKATYTTNKDDNMDTATKP
jgi:flagellin